MDDDDVTLNCPQCCVPMTMTGTHGSCERCHLQADGFWSRDSHEEIRLKIDEALRFMGVVAKFELVPVAGATWVLKPKGTLALTKKQAQILFRVLGAGPETFDALDSFGEELK